MYIYVDMNICIYIYVSVYMMFRNIFVIYICYIYLDTFFTLFKDIRCIFTMDYISAFNKNSIGRYDAENIKQLHEIHES